MGTLQKQNELLYYKKFEHPTSSEWVVFVHGAGGSSSIWFKQLRAYKEHFNLLLIDLRGHGRSNNFFKGIVSKEYSFKEITDDIVEVLDHLNIKSAHFVGMSLGTIIVRSMAELCEGRVKSMVLGGAITRLNFRSRIMVGMGNMCKNFIPFMWLYKMLAYTVMPQKGQKESRVLFVNEAKNLCQKEFKRWFTLSVSVNPLLRYFCDSDIGIPTLYLMGEMDYMFIQPVKEMVKTHKLSFLHEITDCGHVCNVEKPEEFNKESIAFIHKYINGVETNTPTEMS